MYDRIREGFGGVAPRARVLGRLALWALVALIFVRGLGAIFESPTPEPDRTTSSSGRTVDDATAAFAVRFARSFLADPSKGSLAPFFPPSASPPAGASSPGGGREVAQALPDEDDYGPAVDSDEDVNALFRHLRGDDEE